MSESQRLPTSPAGCCTHRCCPDEGDDFSRRTFLGAVGGATLALSGLSWSQLAAASEDLPAAPARRPLVVKPILTYWIPQRQPQTSWRSWGGIQTRAQLDEELARIRSELDKLRGQADFPVEFLPPTAAETPEQVKSAPDVARADVILTYAAGGAQQLLNAVDELGKPIVFFLREKSGPLSFYYEAISPWYFRHNTDQLAAKSADYDDVVVDAMDELLWRLRALCGLKNTRDSRIVAIGKAGGWHAPRPRSWPKNGSASRSKSSRIPSWAS